MKRSTYTGSLKYDELDSGKCPGCGKKKTLLRRLRNSVSFYTIDERIPDHAKAGEVVGSHDGAVCTNRECSLFTDLAKVPTWERATA